MDLYRDTVYKVKIHRSHYPRFKPNSNAKMSLPKKESLEQPMRSYNDAVAKNIKYSLGKDVRKNYFEEKGKKN
eukprot:CAMPEP_0170499514 /NCGR_PEP_ID=MMETSP0208-20121228/31670_1 /TAXON_ID=197538 /ORGANISM="Strombidium inclinatum, Strain S3" /LENGTH=72 /DNA_ID=CAMNT_0010777097 /DNA_START=862 /DNA_END=1080 /DNA_ORIENTATION=-